MLQQQSHPFSKKMRVGSNGEMRSIQMPTTDKKIPMQNLIRANGLNYVMPSQASGVRTRQFKAHYFDKNTYTSGDNVTATCFINSGADFIDTNHSYLTFDLTVTYASAGANAYAAYPGTIDPQLGVELNRTHTAPVRVRGITFGSAKLSHYSASLNDANTNPVQKQTFHTYKGNWGSAINLFREIRIITKSGQEVERIRNLNLLQWYCIPYRASRAFYEKNFSMAGNNHVFFEKDFAEGALGGETNFVINTRTETITCCIPMSLLSGCWAGPGPTKLMPSFLASGMKIELELEDPKTVFSFGHFPYPNANRDGTDYEPAFLEIGGEDSHTISYEIKNMRVVCDSVLLADSIIHTLTKVAAGQMKQSTGQGGLEYYFKTWDVNEYAGQQNSQSVQFESRKAASRVLNQFSVTIPSRASKRLSLCSFASLKPYPIETVQHRLGSFYYPNKILDRDVEQYFSALWANDKMNIMEEMSQNVSFDQFMNERIGITAVTFERSAILPLSGVPTNNTRTLTTSLTIKQNQFNQEKKHVHCLEHVKIIRIFKDNQVVRE